MQTIKGFRAIIILLLVITASVSSATLTLTDDSITSSEYLDIDATQQVNITTELLATENVTVTNDLICSNLFTGDITATGVWTNDGTIRQSGEYWLYNTIGLLYPYVHMSSAGIEVYDGTVAETVVVNITNAGDIVASGNITADNVWLSVYLFAHTNSSQLVTVAGTWINVTFNEEPATNQSITHNHADATNHTFTIQIDGMYRVNYHISFQSTANELARSSSRLLLNGVEIRGSLMDKTSYKGHNTTSLSNTIIIS